MPSHEGQCDVSDLELGQQAPPCESFRVFSVVNIALDNFVLVVVGNPDDVALDGATPGSQQEPLQRYRTTQGYPSVRGHLHIVEAHSEAEDPAGPGVMSRIGVGQCGIRSVASGRMRDMIAERRKVTLRLPETWLGPIDRVLR